MSLGIGPRKDDDPVFEELEKYKKALELIASLWPEPPNCADINEVNGINDGRSRAIIASAAIEIARKALGKLEAPETMYVVRLYDGMDNQWIDVSGPLPYDEANKIWQEKTDNGTKRISFDEIDYYKVFPADTEMVFSKGFGER
jgi:hypothetical protein